MMCLWASYKKKNEKNIFFASLKSIKSLKESDPELGPDPDPLVRGTDPGIRIRIPNKMTRIPNTVLNTPQIKSNTKLLF
jgi:hypothetical protein